MMDVVDLTASSSETANLGLASTEQLFRELICRFEMTQYEQQPGVLSVEAPAAVRRALVLAEMLGGLDAPTREYRTVDAG